MAVVSRRAGVNGAAALPAGLGHGVVLRHMRYDLHLSALGNVNCIWSVSWTTPNARPN